MLTLSAVAQLRRSVAMLEPGRPDGLDRDTALTVLVQPEEVQSAQRHCAVICSHCGNPVGELPGLIALRAGPRRSESPTGPS